MKSWIYLILLFIFLTHKTLKIEHRSLFFLLDDLDQEDSQNQQDESSMSRRLRTSFSNDQLIDLEKELFFWTKIILTILSEARQELVLGSLIELIN